MLVIELEIWLQHWVSEVLQAVRIACQATSQVVVVGGGGGDVRDGGGGGDIRDGGGDRGGDGGDGGGGVAANTQISQKKLKVHMK